MIRLVIVDDHPVVRSGIQGMLTNHTDIKVIGEASNGREALEVISQTLPDVVLIDLRMPEMDGLTAIKKIKSQWPTIQILVLTTYDGDSDLLQALESGATGYILKDSPREDLFKAIRSVAEGKSVLAPHMATLLVERVRTPTKSILSSRELEVLRMVAQGASNREIAAQLYISEATVKTHLARIFDKLKVDDRTAAVTIAVQKGLLRM